MCGIAGVVEPVPVADPAALRAVAEAMTATQVLRGPDAGGVWHDERAALGHRRLAVIDVDGGVQPMLAGSEGTRTVLSYSGEVYNHHALRAELRSRGHRFDTRSDTEVVLAGYREWGLAVLDRLEGMFAFAVWDQPTGRLVLGRDRLGVKPLYWARTPTGGVAFGSEPKALFAHPGIDPVADVESLRDGYALLFSTWPGVYAGVAEVEPGGWLLFDADGVRTGRYWQLELCEHTGGPEATADHVAALVERAARSRLEADVEICSLLSGGLDSSVVTAFAAAELRDRRGPDAVLRSYAVDYTDQAREFTGDVLRTGHDTPYAAEAGAHIGTDHSVTVLDPAALLDLEHRRAVVAARDSPIGVGDMDTSLYLLFGRIREHSTVALSGEAADEVFGGYPWFHAERPRAAATFPWLLVTGDDAAVPLHPDLAAAMRIGEFRADTYAAALAAVPHHDDESPEQHRSRELQHLSLTRWVRQLLHRKDRLSMAHGLEVRVPYCDHRLVEYAFSVPWSEQTRDGREKSLLRSAGAKHLPESVLWRAKNHYPATHDPGYTTGLQELARDALTVDGVTDVVDRTRIDPLLDAPAEGLDWGTRLRLERVVDLALWLDVARPALRI